MSRVICVAAGKLEKVTKTNVAAGQLENVTKTKKRPQGGLHHGANNYPVVKKTKMTAKGVKRIFM